MATIKSIISGFLGLKKDPNATTQDVAVIKAEDTNAGIVLKPNGTGAIMATVPDGTATGGNARGIYSVDLQMYRTAADQVAFGTYGFIGGGKENKIQANGDQIVIAGGQGNIAGRDYVTIGGGLFNKILATTNGSRGTISGGEYNTVSSDYSTISGGQSNTASTGTHATVMGGYLNTSSGAYSMTCGYQSTASAWYGGAFGYFASSTGSHGFAFGQQASASGVNSIALGVSSHANGEASASFQQSYSNGIRSVAMGGATSGSRDSLATGGGAYTSLTGEFSVSSGSIAYKGSHRGSQLVLPLDTGVISAPAQFTFTGIGGELIIFQDAIGDNVVPQNTHITATIIVGVRGLSAGVTGLSMNDIYSVKYDFFARKKTNGTRSILGTPVLISTFSDASMSSTAVNISIGASDELLISFTPPSWAGGDVRLWATLNLEVTALGLHQENL